MSFITGVPGVVSALSDYKLDNIHQLVQQKVLALAAYAHSMGYKINITSGYRDYFSQAARSGSPYGAALPGKSTHEGYIDLKPTGVVIGRSLAIDLNIIDVNNQRIDTNNYLYRQYGATWEQLGPIVINGITLHPYWGGRFRNPPDPIHYDYRTTSPQTPLNQFASTPSSQTVGVTLDQGSNSTQLADAAMKEALTKPCPGVG